MLTSAKRRYRPTTFLECGDFHGAVIRDALRTFPHGQEEDYSRNHYYFT